MRKNRLSQHKVAVKRQVTRSMVQRWERIYLREFDSIDQFKAELVEYLDYYNNHRIKAKLKGFRPTSHRQQVLSVV